MSRLIDAHVHIGDFKQSDEISKKLADVRQYALCVSNSPEDYQRIVKCNIQNKYVKVALGFHPHNCNSMKFNSFLFMKNLYTTKYIGEVGLDFSINYIDKAVEQIKIFEFICDIAAKNNKLLTIHCVKAEDQLLDILKYTNVKNAIIHWYRGRTEKIKNFIDAGYYFSINYRMVKTDKFKSLLREIPKEKILVESDAPYTLLKEDDYLKTIVEIYNHLYKYGIDSKNIFMNFKNILEKMQ